MKYFHAYELVPKYIYEVSGEACLGLFDPEALLALDDLREFFGCPIIVNNWNAGGGFQCRGYRTLADQMAVNPKSSGHSAHQIGKAFDCDVQGYTAEQARKHILENQDDPLLRRWTRMESGVSWIHADVMALPKGMRRIHLFKA